MASDTTQPSRGNIGAIIRRATKALGDVFVPIIPAIVASGLLMGLTEGIDNAMGNALQMNSWWILIHTFSNASFVFLQILIGFSAARVFGGNEFLGGVIGMVMNHPSLINAWNIPTAIRTFGVDAYQTVGSSRAATWLSVVTGTTVSASGASTSAIIDAGGIPQVDLGLLDVTLQGYQGHVVPVVIAVLLMCKLEKWLHAHVPDMLDLFVTPLVTVLLTSLATMMFIGPLFSFVEDLVLSFFKFLMSIPFGLGGALAGAIYPLTVVMGVHHMFNALEAGLCAQTPPYDTFNPIISAANVAQGAACLAVAVKTVSARKRGLALPSGISALLGITEPAIYGVNLPIYRPFAAAMAGGAAGGTVAALLDLHSSAYGITGLFGYLIVSDTVGYSLAMAVAFLVAFAATMLLYNDDEKTKAEAARAAAKATDAEKQASLALAADAAGTDDASATQDEPQPEPVAAKQEDQDAAPSPASEDDTSARAGSRAGGASRRRGGSRRARGRRQGRGTTGRRRLRNSSGRGRRGNAPREPRTRN